MTIIDYKKNDDYISNLTRTDIFVLRFFGVLLIISGILHLYHLLGLIPEKTPYLIELYFDSLTVFDILAGIGFIFVNTQKTLFKKALILSIIIAVTNIPINAYMIYLDFFMNYQSGYSIMNRCIDIGLLLFGLWYVRKSYDGTYRFF